MSAHSQTEWNPGTYERFRGLRLQPALDLLSGVSDLPAGDVIDLGCGSGTVGKALKERFPDRALTGIDNSATMLTKAAGIDAYTDLAEADIRSWVHDTPPAVIYSNAALQWLDGHDELLPALVGHLPTGGMLAVQMPFQNEAPSHRGWGEAFGALFPDRAVGKGPEILSPEDYFNLLSPLGDVRLWQTEYLQQLPPSDQGHPVRLFTESTFARPFLEAVSTAEKPELIAAYEAAMARVYPLRPDGSVLFSFRRLFFILRKV